MKSHEDIEREVERTLATLDNSPKAKAPAFFYTRLKARLDEAGQSRGSLVSRSRVSFGILGLVVLIALNAFALIKYQRQVEGTAQEQYRQSFVSEYGLSTSID